MLTQHQQERAVKLGVPLEHVDSFDKHRVFVSEVPGSHKTIYMDKQGRAQIATFSSKYEQARFLLNQSKESGRSLPRKAIQVIAGTPLKNQLSQQQLDRLNSNK